MASVAENNGGFSFDCVVPQGALSSSDNRPEPVDQNIVMGVTLEVDEAIDDCARSFRTSLNQLCPPGVTVDALRALMHQSVVPEVIGMSDTERPLAITLLVTTEISALIEQASATSLNGRAGDILKAFTSAVQSALRNVAAL